MSGIVSIPGENGWKASSARVTRGREGVVVFAGLRCIGAAVALLAAGTLAVPTLRACPQQPVPSKAPAAAAVPQAIPASEVVIRDEDQQASLRGVQNRLAAEPTVRDLDEQCTKRGDSLRQGARGVYQLLGRSPSVVDLRQLGRYWAIQLDSLMSAQEQLAHRADSVQKEIRLLNRQQVTWEATRAQIKAETELQPLAQRIEGAVVAIQAAQAKAREQLDQISVLQDRVAQQQSIASETVDAIEAAIARHRKQVWERSSPFWDAPWRQESGQTTGFLNWKLGLTFSTEFLKAETFALVALTLTFLAILLAAVGLRRKLPVWIEQRRFSPEAARILDRPASLALLLTLAPMLPALLGSPLFVYVASILVLLIAAIRVVPLLVGPDFQPFLYTLLAFFLLSTVRAFGRTIFVQRAMYAAGGLAAVVLIGWLTRAVLSKRLALQGHEGRRPLVAIRFAQILLVLTFLLNLAGYFDLARTLDDAVLYGSCLGVVLYATVRSGVIFASMLLQTDSALSIATLRLGGNEMLKWVARILTVGAAVAWLAAILDLLNFRHEVFDGLASALNSSMNLGRVSLSPRDLLTFFLVLAAGFALSRMVRLFLLEDVLGRIDMERGLPDAISTTVYYVLVVTVVMVALAGSGVELSRFNVLTGAFGVGVGFGLQSVISNFASGLILKYEHLIHVHDTVELLNVTGVVQKVGARATVIATGEGAEVIIPNNALMANQVTNWTLSSPKRRAVLQVPIAHGTAPRKVIELLTAVATSHPDVLQQPAPVALFIGFGEKALNFELSFWVPSFAVFATVKGEVAVAVSEALKQAGIESH
ncbi:MAG TPA: mechanosensitive ion channel domain-containing protein [Terriglobia bacterium]